MPRTASRAGLLGMLVALVPLLLLPVGIGSAGAADAYRYWSYWWGTADGTWEFAQTGPADRIVTDGDVEGWRYLASADAVPADEPALAADFAAICTDGEPVPGSVRVGVVIDYGTPDIAPAGSQVPEGGPRSVCVTVPQGSTAEQALAQAGAVRSEQGATCGIDGYPAAGCFEVVAAAPEAFEAETAASEENPFRRWFIVIPIAAAVIVTIAIALGKQRSGKQPAA